MPFSDLALLRRKELVGTFAWIAWGLWVLLASAGAAGTDGIWVFLCYLAGWAFTVIWVSWDARSRGRNRFGWTLLTILTGPLGFAAYYLTRKPVPSVCSRCGGTKPDAIQTCPTCGHVAPLARAKLAFTWLYSSLDDSLVHGPVEQAKETAKHVSFALAACSVIGTLLLILADLHPGLVRSLVSIVWTISTAAYWVLIAWWVYLDSSWRKMDGVPWAVLTLMTNAIGMVTYLVIRYPDPRSCARCGASVPTGHRYCPFCGSEAESMCPHCQAVVKPGWQFCPVCAARLTPSEEANPSSEFAPISTITITGSVLDALHGTPIAGARVEIDSRGETTVAATDSLGKFQLSGLDQRPYVLVASAEGYLPQAKAYSPGTRARNLCFTLHIG